MSFADILDEKAEGRRQSTRAGLAILERVHEVCPIPATAQRVVSLTSDPDVSIAAVAETVASDPALASELMRIANSPVFGRARAVGSVEEAIMMVGLSELHAMASAMAMLAAFGGRAELSLGLHQASVVSGSIARGLAKASGVDHRKAFLGGLLAEIGALACLAVDEEGYDALFRATVDDPDARAASEVRRYGTTSRAVGAHLLANNGLPEELSTAVGASDVEAGVLGGLNAVIAFARGAAERLLRAPATGDPDHHAHVVEALEALGASLGLSMKGSELVALTATHAAKAGGILARLAA